MSSAPVSFQRFGEAYRIFKLMFDTVQNVGIEVGEREEEMTIPVPNSSSAWIADDGHFVALMVFQAERLGMNLDLRLTCCSDGGVDVSCQFMGNTGAEKNDEPFVSLSWVNFISSDEPSWSAEIQCAPPSLLEIWDRVRKQPTSRTRTTETECLELLKQFTTWFATLPQVPEASAENVQ